MNSRMTRWSGYATVFGGILVHITLGTFYTWGNFSIYALSAIRYFSPPGNFLPRYRDATIVIAFNIVGQAFLLPVSGILAKKIGIRSTVIFGSFIFCLGTYLSYYSTENFYSFVFTYGSMVGFGIGLTYVVTLSAALWYFPMHRGFISGMITAGYGFGSLLYNQLQTQFVNPDNISPSYAPYPDAPDELYYDDVNLLNHTRSLYAFLTIFYGLSFMLGAVCILRSRLQSHPKREDRLELSDVTKSSAMNPLEVHNYGKEDERGNQTTQIFSLEDQLAISSNSYSCCNADEESSLSGISVDGSVLSSSYPKTPVASRDCSQVESGKINIGNTLHGRNAHFFSEDKDAVTQAGIDNPSDGLAADDQKAGADYSVGQALRTTRYYTLTVLFFLQAVAVSFFSSNWKLMYTSQSSNVPLISDFTLSWIASIGSIFNATGRIFWGFICDLIGFHSTLVIISTCWTGFLILLPYSIYWGTWGLGVVVICNFFLLGGNFSIFPAVAFKLYGAENFGIIYSLLNSCGNASGWTTVAFGFKFLQRFWSLSALSFVTSGFTACTVITALLFAVCGRNLGSLPSVPELKRLRTVKNSSD